MRPDGSLRPCGGHAQGKPGFYSSGAAFLEAVRIENGFHPASWMNLYRRTLLADRGLFQPDGRIHEDDEWAYRVFLKAGAVVAAPFCYYNYRIHPASVTYAPSSKTIFDRAENVKSICAFFAAGDYPPRLRRRLATYFCRSFLHAPFLTRTYPSWWVRELLPREDCRKALRECLGTPEQFRSYCRIVFAAKPTQWIFVPFMYLGRWKPLYPLCEYFCRFWLIFLLQFYWRTLKPFFRGKAGRA